MPAPTPDLFRTVAGQFATGVTVVTSVESDGAPCGLTANSFTSVSLDPPLVLVCVAQGSHSHDCILESGRFAVNILDADSHEIADRFWRMDRARRFEGLKWSPRQTGAPVLDNALGYLDCTVTEVHSAGDHTIILGQVAECDLREGEALVFQGGVYRKGST